MVDDETADCGGTLCLRNVACSEGENSDFIVGCGSAHSGTCTRKSYGLNQPPSLPPPPPFPPGQAPPPPPSPCVHDDRKCSSNGNDCYADGESEAQTCSDGYTASPHPDEPNNEGRYTCYPPHCHCDASKCSSDGDDCYADGTWEAQTCSDGYLPIAINDWGQYTCCFDFDQPPSLPPPPPFPPGQAPPPPPSPPPSPCVHDDRKCSSNGNDCYADGESEAQTCSDGYTASPHPDEPNNEGRYTCYPPHCHCDASKCSSDGDDCYADGTWEAQTCSDGYLPIAINDWGQYTCCFDFDQPPSLPPPPPFPPGQAPPPPPSSPPSPCVHDDRKCSSNGNDCYADGESEAQTCSDGYTASPHPDEPNNEGRYTCYPPHCHCDMSKCSSDGDDCYADGTWEAQTCSDGYLPIAINEWGQYTCCFDFDQPPSLPPPPPFPPGQAPPPAPLVCAQIDWENGADAGCDLFFAAGATCESVWSDYCGDDNPAGAEFNTQTLASSGCSQCATTSPSPPPSCTSFPYWTDPANCRVGDCEMYKDQVCDGGACQALAQTLNNDVDGWCDSSSVPVAAIVGGTVGGLAFLSILAGTIHRSRFKQRTVPPPSTPTAQQPQLEASEIPVAQAVVKV